MTKKLMYALFLVVMGSGFAWAQPMTLKFACIDPPKHFIPSIVMPQFFEKIEKDSGGALKFEIYSAGTLGHDPTKYLKQLRDGVFDIAMIYNPYQPGVFPDDAVFDLPFTVRNALEGSIAFSRMVKKGMLDGYDTAVWLGTYVVPQYAIHTTFPVKRPEDLKGKKIRVAGQMQQKMFEALGATPVGMPINKVAEGLSKGVVDGLCSEWSAMGMWGIVDLVKYHYMARLGAVTISTAINKDVYAKLPANCKTAIDKHSGEPLSRKLALEWDKSYNEEMQKAQQKPAHHIYSPSKPEEELWKTQIQPAVETWKKTHPKGDVLIKALENELTKIGAQ